MVSQIMHSPRPEHFDNYKILKYLKETPRKGLLFENYLQIRARFRLG